MSKNFLLLVLTLLYVCDTSEKHISIDNPLSHSENTFNSVEEIPLPGNYKRIAVQKGSFAEWMRTIRFKKDNRVYLYNGKLKPNQSAHFVVLDIPVGKKNLQQCADAIMRLRAEYLFNKKKYNEISFFDNSGKEYKWSEGADRTGFENYLEKVFGWCGSASLEKQLNPVNDLTKILPGDVFIKGGFPGHAMIVIDVAIDGNGQKVFMLAQSYMPAQDIHIVKNPLDKKLNPWYAVCSSEQIITPEYKFHRSNLRTW